MQKRRRATHTTDVVLLGPLYWWVFGLAASGYFLMVLFPGARPRRRGK